MPKAKAKTKKPAAKKKPAARRPARKVAKVSPLKGMSVDAWVTQKLSGWQHDVAKKLVALVKSAAPEAQAVIKWGQPIFEHGGPFAYIKAATNHLNFGFWRGADLQDPHGMLEGGARMKHVKIRGPEGFDPHKLGAFVREALHLNKTKGNPTQR